MSRYNSDQSWAANLIREALRVLEGEYQFDDIIVVEVDGSVQRLDEGSKWILDREIRIDTPHDGGGPYTHAHIYGVRGRGAEIGAINITGTRSHGKVFTLTKRQAAALTAHGFTIPASRLVEWSKIDGGPLQVLLG